MKLTIKELNQIFELYSRKYLSLNEHPNFSHLRIATYTSKTEIDEVWDEYPILRRCRGLVFDDVSRRIIINCIPKFFNQGTKFAPDLDMLDEDIQITEKQDGYLIQIKFDKEYGLIVTSKSSFESKYAQYVYNKIKNEKDFVSDYTYICELCKDFPGDEGIIVTKHPQEEIYVWAIINEKGKEISIKNVPKSLKKIKSLSLEEAILYLNNKVEGVVIKKGNERVKLKTDWFFSTHKAISQCTKKHVWELFKQNISIKSIANSIPDEFLQQMLEWESEFQTKYDDYEKKILKLYNQTKSMSDKELGLSNFPFKSILFSIRKTKPYNSLIYKEIENES